MKRWIVIAVLVLGVLGVSAWLLVRRASGAAPRWETRTLDEGELVLKVSAAGSLEPRATVQVGSQVSGIVKEVRVRADEPVKEGQVLAMLDRELLEREYKDRGNVRDLAQLRIAHLKVEEDNLKLREETLAQRLARLAVEKESLRAQVELALRNLQRYEQMKRNDAAGEMEVDARRLEEVQAAAQLALKDIEKQALETERKQIATDREALALKRREAELTVAQAETAVEKARVNLGYATVVAPISGVVLDRLVEPGQTIAASFQTPNLFTLAAGLERLRIQAQVDEADAVRVRIAQPVTFEVDAFRGEKFTGIVQAVRLKHVARGNAITYPVVIEADNPPSEGFPLGRLRPGMTAYLTFEVGRRTCTRLPTAALRFAPPEGTFVDRAPDDDPAGSGRAPFGSRPTSPAKKDTSKQLPDAPRGMKAVVYVASADGRLRTVRVRVGDCDGEYYELLSDELKAGDRIVTGLSTSPPGAEAGKDGEKKDDVKVELKAGGSKDP
jgi:HlyD family secretion protein